MFAAIDASPLNAFSHLDREHATLAAGVADVSLPFGGVPIGVKELDEVAGWPYTHASVPFADQIATATSTMVHRIRDLGGAVLAGQTTASEFGGVNVTRTVLHGTTRNPWQLDRTPGGSSGGSAAAVAGGLLTLATGGDGGGSIRIPAGFCGLVGLKATFGRIPLSPNADVRQPHRSSSAACRARSATRPAGSTSPTATTPRDPLSLPRVEGWEAGLGTLADAAARAARRGRRRLGRRRRVAGDVGAARGCRRRPDRRRRLGARRRRRHRAAADGRGVVDQRDDRHRRRARRRAGRRAPTTSRPRSATAMERSAGALRADARARIERRRMEVNEAMARIFDPRRRRRPRHHGEQPRRRLRRRRSAADDVRRRRGRAPATTAC